MFVECYFFAVVELDGSAEGEAVLFQDVLHFLVAGVCVDAEGVDAAGAAHVFYQVEDLMADAFPAGGVGEGHPVDDDVRFAGVPFSTQGVIGGFSIVVDAEVS